ncbi:alanine racemase [Tepidiforma flava]|uniref:Alanine racemase n=1 Tax=Tepidiforma flava TaxID=3004094 RepID=A0ABY7MBE5_9CHLR|nr:alanine racemase [Tepidiforma flava]WBL37332.1 alanine racemase [Tepidiforma flava]
MAHPPITRNALAEVTAALNAWLEIDLDALAANVRTLKSLLGPVELIAVVKANAYGAGASVVAPALEAAGVDRFAVVWPHEGYLLRQAGVTRPILVLGHAFPADATQAVRARLTLTCHSRELAAALSAAAVDAGTTADVHIKFDTGLHRFGVELEDGIALAEYCRTLPGLRVEGLTTHMANADEADDSFSEEQHRRFAQAAEALPWVPYRHTANTATALRREAFRYSGVRIGLALHGELPANTPGPALRQVLALRARLARVSDVAPGEGVSYGLTWRAARPTRAGLIPVGYADGWRRSLSNAGEVLVGGRRCPVIGRVCMDQFLADVTDVPGAKEGDVATLLGADGSDRLTATEVARLAGTIAWDLLAGLSGRLPRIYHRSGSVVTIVPPAW